MLARYRIVRGKRPQDEPLPSGKRVDVRKHTGHVLSPDPGSVDVFLSEPNEASFRRFAAEYRALLRKRFAADRAPFDELSDLARAEDVYLGCNCPTKRNPDVRHCHTVLALDFMKSKYPKLKVVLPG